MYKKYEKGIKPRVSTKGAKPALPTMTSTHKTPRTAVRSIIVESCLSRCFNNFAAFTKHLRNLLILMRQQPESVSNIVPLPLALSTRKSGSQLAGQLLGMLVL